MVNEYIKNDLEKRKIKYLTHFTHVSNLESIMNNGLLSVESLNHNKFIFEKNDDKRIDDRLNATSLSVSFPNYKMFSKYRLYQVNRPNMVVLLIDSSVILYKNCLFCSENAAKKSISSSSDEILMSNNAWDCMFKSESEGRSRDQLEIPDNYPTNPQAEILCLDTIEPTYIEKIIYPSKEEFDKWATKFPQIEKYILKSSIPKNPISSYFSCRRDYSHWK